MRKIVIGLLLMLAVFFCGGMSGCVLLTRFEQYDISQVSVNAAEPNAAATETNALLYVHFAKTKSESWIVPGFYSSEVLRGPFRHNVAVWGNFESLDAITATIQMDDQEAIPLTIDIDRMNASCKQARDGRNIFVCDDSFTVESPWEDFEMVTVRATVEVMVNGEKQTIELLRKFEKRYRRRTTNRLFSALMSV